MPVAKTVFISISKRSRYEHANIEMYIFFLYNRLTGVAGH